MNEENNTNKYLPTKISLTVRILVGVYLLYTAYSLTGAIGTHTGGELLFFIFFTAAFAVIGAALILLSGRALIKGKYAGGTFCGKKDENGSDGL